MNIGDGVIYPKIKGIRFARKVDYYRSLPGDKHAKAIKIIDECIEEGILVEFLKEHRAEVLEIMDYLFDPDKIYKAYDNSLIEQGRAEGRQEGRANMLHDLVARGIVTKELADQILAEETGVTQK